MRDPTRNPANDLERAMSERAQAAWDAMSDDVRFAMRKRLFQMSAMQALKGVGAHFRDGAWSITPYPGLVGFGALGLTGCKFIYEKLCEQGV